MNVKQLRLKTALAAAGVAISLASLNPDALRAEGPLGIFQRKGKTTESAPEEPGEIRLFFTSTPWETVLSKLATETNSVLVADTYPPGRFSRKDIRKYSRTQAVRIVNEDLQRSGFRLIEKGRHLVLIDVKARSAEFQRQTIGQSGSAPARVTVTDIGSDGRQRYYQRSAATIRPGQSRVSQTAQRFLPGPGLDGRIQRTGYQAEVTETEQPPAAKPEPETPSRPVQLAFTPEHRTGRSLMSTIYSAFKDRAKGVEEGPGGLPGIEVYSAVGPDGQRSVLFAMSMDQRTGEILVAGDSVQAGRIVRLLQRLDMTPTRPDEATRVLTTDKNAGKIANELKPAVAQLVGQNSDPTDPAAPPTDPADAAGQPGGEFTDVVGGIRGNVSVEAMEELGVLIFTGNGPDVDAVMEIVRQIEELSAKTAPDIHVRLLENVDSTALAELLTTVYEQLNQARGRSTQQGAQISVIAVGRPNAVLVLAPAADVESVNELIDQLDKPIKPETSYAVFMLKHAIASQLEQLMEDFYDDRGGLEARATVATEVRTNSLIVMAKPNDLREIAALVKKLDTHDSGSVSEVRVVELRHSVAEDLANTVNQVIQSVLNPPQLGQGQLGQAFLGFGGGNASQALREVRSAVLEYLVVDDPNQRRLRSGILADIRINGDARSNTVIITAPKESLDLVEQLVRRLDKPSSTVATIKHFTLKNADATSVTSLLNELFGDNTTGQSNTQVGVALAGAENSASVVPLRFSTDVRTNSIVAVGPAEALDVVEALLYRLDESDIRDRNTTIIRLKNAPAADIATAVDGFLQQQTELLQAAGNELISPFEFIEREVIIQAEPYTNSLLISSTPRYYDQIRELVLTLDQELAQVVIQVLLVEVTLEDTDEFGIELGAQDPILFGRGGTNTTTSPSTLVPGFDFNSAAIPNSTANRQEVVAGQALSSFMVGRASDTAGFGGLVLSASSEYLNVLLRALEQNREMEVLSRPLIRTLDNRPALIRMVREQQVISGFNVNQTTGALNPVLDDKDAGITLQVTPTISPEGNILLSLTAEKSQFIPNAGPVLSFDDQGNALTRGVVRDLAQAETTVVVADEQTIVIGGLITKSTDSIERRVPWLSDVPLIGKAFGFDQENVRRTELLIFLTPRVVKGHEYGEMLKQIEADRLHFTEWEAEQIHGPLYGIPEPMTEPGGTWQQLTPPEPVPSVNPTDAEAAPAAVPAADDGTAARTRFSFPSLTPRPVEQSVSLMSR